MVTDSMVLSLPTFWTSASSHFIVDQDNRTRVFHGVNFVQKGFPWYPQALLDDDHIKSLRDMGLNTVRLGWMWTGAEPTQGHYNLTYFDIMGGIVDNLAKYGIYAFLDVHQDVLSSYYCSYDGAPTWAVDMSDPSKHATPWPLPSDVNNHNCSSKGGWAVNYASESCGTAFQTLFKDGPFRDSFAAFWKRTATYFKNKPILGYEIINEPWCGNQYADLELMLPGVAGHKNLMPFYDVITDSIRSVDDQHLIFFEPVTWGMIFNGSVIGSGFDTVPGGTMYANKAVFSFHYYCWWYDDTGMNIKTCDHILLSKVFDEVIRTTKQIGGSAMLTEWGQGCDYDHSSPNNSTSECNAIMDMADKHYLGWTDWYFGEHLGGSNWALTENAQKIFSRTFAHAVAGTPEYAHFDVATKEFKLCFKPNHDVDSSANGSVTEIFARIDLNYPNGIVVSSTPNVELIKIDTTNNRVLFRNRGKFPDIQACITLSPK